MKIDNLEKLVIKTIESIKTETDINAFLTFAGHGNLHNLSIENLLAVYGQNPEAVLVGSFNQWKKRGRYPKQGSGIAVYPGNTTGMFGKYCEYLFDYGDTNGREEIAVWRATEEQRQGFLDMHQANMDYAAFAKVTLYSLIQNEFYEKESDLYFDDEDKTEAILELVSECAAKIFMERSGENYALSELAVNTFKKYILTNDNMNTALFLKTLGVATRAAHNTIAKLNMYIEEERRSNNEQTTDYRRNETDGRDERIRNSTDIQSDSANQDLSGTGGSSRRTAGISTESNGLPAAEISGTDNSYAEQRNAEGVPEAENRRSSEYVRERTSENAGSGKRMGDGYNEQNPGRRADWNDIERDDRERDPVSSINLLEQGTYSQISLFSYMSTVAEDNMNSNSIDVTDMMIPEKISIFPFSSEIIDYILLAGSAGYRLESRNAIYNYFVTRWGDSLDHERATEYIKKELQGASLGFRVEGREISVYYGFDGMHLKYGKEGSLYSPDMLLPWNDVENHIYRLIEKCRYMDKTGETVALQADLESVATDISYYFYDAFDIGKEELPALFRDTYVHSDIMTAVQNALMDKSKAEYLLEKAKEFWNQCEMGEISVKFRYAHDYARIEHLESYLNGRHPFSLTENIDIPEVTFIPDDAFLLYLGIQKSSERAEEIRFKIYNASEGGSDAAALAKFINQTYGVSGSGYSGYNMMHDSKGFDLRMAKDTVNRSEEVHRLLSNTELAKCLCNVIKREQFWKNDIEIQHYAQWETEKNILENAQASFVKELEAERNKLKEIQETEFYSLQYLTETEKIEVRKKVIDYFINNSRFDAIRGLMNDVLTSDTMSLDEKTGFVHSIFVLNRRKVFNLVGADYARIGTSYNSDTKYTNEQLLINCFPQNYINSVGWFSSSNYTQMTVEEVTEDEYKSARSSCTDSFYTPREVIAGIYNALDRFGFKGGNVLEPALGIGNFYNEMDVQLEKNSNLYGVEIDSISGRIARLLHPNANIQICGIENAKLQKNYYDVVIGNVPFGEYKVFDQDFRKEDFLIHDYFFAKALELCAPGGIIAFVTSKGTLDKKNIIGLYTDDSIVKIVDGGKTLNIPAKVAGRTVIGIGSGVEEHPFIPASERSWTSVSFPSSVAIIQDYAFYKSSAMANVVIPSSITNIGVKAFYASSIESLKVNGMSGTIGSLAFGDAHALTNVTLKGGDGGLTISTIAFRESNATAVTINGKVTLNKNAFKNNQRLGQIYISGNVILNEYAFSGCTAVDSLQMNGNISVGKYAFNNLTSLEYLFIPAGVKVEEYAFNNCTHLNKLETDTNLVNHAFENCDSIQTLILDENVTNVAFDWEGHTGSYNNRKVYVKNKNTLFEMYGKDSNYVSAFGSSGDVVVYILNDQTVDQGRNVEPNGNVLSLLGYTCYAHSLDYSSYITGLANSVTFYSVNSIDAQLMSDHVVSDKPENVPQTGIDAYYNGVILTTRDIVKDNMTVIPIYGSNEGTTTYSSDEFYIIRTTEFNELENAQTVTEEGVSAFEPVHAMDTDLDAGQETGTISVTVVVFYEKDGAEAYFSVPVSVRVEEYTDKSFVEQEYGSYENIVKELASLSQKVEQLQQEIEALRSDKNADTEKINQLSVELTAYKRAYEALLEKFSEFVSSSTTDDSGYFGKYEDPDTGEVKDVVYIEGNPIEYEDTGETTQDGKKIYICRYDVDGDGEAETIKFYVDERGVHIVDDTGTDTGKVFEDTLGAIQRQTAAKLKEIEKALNASQTGLNSIIEALKEAGYDFDLDVTVDEQYKEVVKDIKDMAERIKNLEAQLSGANQMTSQYESALASIYALLTNSTLDQDNVSGINNTLLAITSKISTLQNNLDVAKATVKDLQDKLTTAEQEYSALEEELATTKSQLQKANEDLANAQQQKEDLIAQYEKALADGDTAAAERLQAQIAETENAIQKLTALQSTLVQKEQDIKEAQDTISQLREQLDKKNQEIADLRAQLDALTDTADGFKITVDTANKMFGLTLPDGSTDKEIADAIQNYVRDKITSDETIEAIQKLLNTDKTGKELVAAVKTAIENAGDENPSDDVADPDSNNYKTGYQRGYEEGVTAGAAGKTDDKVVNMQSESYKQGYSTGYNQGYAKALTDNPNSDGNGSSSSDYSALKDQINGLTSQVTNLTTKNSQLQSKVDKLEDDVDDLEKDNKKLSSANSSLEEKNSSLSSQVNSLNSELSGLKTTNTNLTSQVTELNSKNGSLSNQVTDLTTKNNSLTSEMSTLRTQVNNANRNTTTPAASSTSKQENKTTASDTKDAASKEQRKGEADDGDVIEGSTNNLDTKTETKSTAVPDALVGSTVAAENSQKRLGTTSEVSMFSDTEINTIPGTQYATGKVIRFAESNPIVKFSDTNGKEINDITDDSLENIYKIFNYYANHLEELGNLGSDEVINAANDESKAVILSLVGAGDIKPNVTQETAFRNNRSAILNLKFPNITTGALYLVVHERADQAGQYEVCLTTATDNSLSLNVSSLSPVAVAKVEIKDATAVVNSTFTEDVEAMNTEKPAETNTGGFRVVMTVLIILMLLVSVGIVVILKLKREGKLPQFLSFLYN